MSDQQPPSTPSPPAGEPDPWARPSGDPTAPQSGPPHGSTPPSTPPTDPYAAPPSGPPAAPPSGQTSGAPQEPPGQYGAPPPGQPGPPAQPGAPAGPYGPPTEPYAQYGGAVPGQPWYPGAPATWPAPAYGGGWYPPGLDPHDSLVTPPGAGVGGWWARCVGAVRRGWPVLLPILLLTQVLPGLLVSLLSLAVDPSARWESSMAENPDALPDNFLPDLAVLFGVLLGGLVLFGLLQAIGWAAGTWVVARQAAGEPVGVGDALRHGVRRALGLWGWSLLVGLLITVGVCFCILPGIYLAFALSLAGPVYLFERHNPIGRSFRMFHDRFGMVLGRVALVAAAVVLVSLAAVLVEAVAGLPFGATPLDSPGTTVGIVLVSLVGAVLTLPAQLAQLVGLVVTYAEQRAYEGPVNAARLAAELG
ncbi:hypothetical protein [Micromonospora endolithica]|uniref:Glycerophosphoryl diester phosphodiesterase membrane domain-containing protein n=1 Tax=Micromonospora endolithica TaxID=230091 RepID=A0A3A9YSQ1_9ACTN|nr:hypothetical protein [Micromonospora endolithica]RKN39071.1 hypothetical protein D7223_29355 [Micromonospora endolithica]TWJ25568.1 hypothetical protein JD76_05741 [Micromonospora endolithica]